MREKPTDIAVKAHTISRVILLLFSIVGIRLWYLQIICARILFDKAQRNFLRLESIPAPRGLILDCNGSILAANRPVVSLFWQGSGSSALTNHHKQILKVCQEILTIPLLTDTMRSSIEQAERFGKKRMIAHDLTFDQLSKLKEQCGAESAILFETSFQRFYPYTNCASHIIGHLGKQNDILQGKAGLELVCNEQLSGKPGCILSGIDSSGIATTKTIVKEQIRGETITTTLDINLQKISETVFPDYYNGALILIDPHDGSIKALVSKPDFNPELFLTRFSTQTWNSLQEKKPFLNRALNTYPPGSIFKLIVISAALETGLITQDDTWNCKGFSYYGKRKYWCHRHSGHGILSTKEAVAHSCNILFFQTAQRISVDIIAEYAKKFGLGSKTGCLLSERDGLVPTKLWKQECKGEPWWPGETLSVSIGQSYLLATPLQIARMVGAIFTGSLINPRILVDEPIISTPLDLQPNTIEFLKESMKDVITYGTGKKLNKIKDVELYAKTSTAQNSKLGKHLLDRSYLEHGWFVAHFQYKDHDPLVMVILVENVGTSQIPTAIARELIISYKKYSNSL